VLGKIYELIAGQSEIIRGLQAEIKELKQRIDTPNFVAHRVVSGGTERERELAEQVRTLQMELDDRE